MARTSELTLIQNTAAALSADTRVYPPDFVLSPTDTADRGKHKFCNGINTYSQLPFSEDAAGGGSAWGSITGTLSDQTDLDDELSALSAEIGDKQPARDELDVVNYFHSTGQGTLSDPIPAASSISLQASTLAGDTVFITSGSAIDTFTGGTRGCRRTLYFTAAVTVNHSSPGIVLPGSANVTFAAGDKLEIICTHADGDEWAFVSPVAKATGKPIAGAGVASVYDAIMAPADPPTETSVLANQLGSVTWTKQDVGIWNLGITGAFTADKTGLSVTVANSTDRLMTAAARLDADNVRFYFYDSENAPADPGDTIRTKVEVYP